MANFGSETRPPFGAWLAQQRHRQGWIEDLMEFAREDPAFPKEGDPNAVREYLRTAKAGVGLMHAVDDAEIEWTNA